MDTHIGVIHSLYSKLPYRWILSTWYREWPLMETGLFKFWREVHYIWVAASALWCPGNNLGLLFCFTRMRQIFGLGRGLGLRRTGFYSLSCYESPLQATQNLIFRKAEHPQLSLKSMGVLANLHPWKSGLNISVPQFLHRKTTATFMGGCKGKFFNVDEVLGYYGNLGHRKA